MKRTVVLALVLMLVDVLLHAGLALAQLIDRTQNPNTANAGIAKSLSEQIGAGRGDVDTPDSSAFIIARDPARAVRRDRQIFQRKSLAHEGQGPLFPLIVLRARRLVDDSTCQQTVASEGIADGVDFDRS